MKLLLFFLLPIFAAALYFEPSRHRLALCGACLGFAVFFAAIASIKAEREPEPWEPLRIVPAGEAGIPIARSE